ncbi:DNA polymerase II large subunit [Ferroplasma sp.]|uniref:DNA polymerase II large subunit n=1 Tax=Ferroplasma sp. TaxID=2591003 RepID=UPI0026196E7B|nr:DNA polymerase II large subunit [Ferroplasma sp.]MCL4452496.1 DNA polymerase II large subunit [Candidatus Thermoplasmatota archaeon]
MIDHNLDKYNKALTKSVNECYEIALEARSLGKDVSTDVEIPLANDMAERVEKLIQIDGIANDIRELSKTKSREEVSLEISRKVAEMLKSDRRMALEKSVRVGLAILTEGILVAPLEGIKEVNIVPNDDGTEYVDIVYSGPIRSAGGTAQALSVLMADIVRRELNIGSFKATDEEIERYIEEIQAYNRSKHLQYLPTPDEIRLVIGNSPVMIDGEGSEEEEISGHRDMKRIPTNRIRGGMCLVLCEGLIQKSRKVLKYTNLMNLKEWDILEKIGKNKTEEKGDTSQKYLRDIIAGRPVFGYPNRPGGFRLRYGRSRLSGLAAASINPVSMYIVNQFIAIGSQIKVELPGKAAAITPCDTIDGPSVLLKSGEHRKIRTVDEAKSIEDQIEMITDIGEILIAYGDFLENNKNLVKSPFTVEWWSYYLPDDLKKFEHSKPDQFEAVEISKKYNIPLYPEYDYYWHDLTLEELKSLISMIKESKIENGKLHISPEAKNILIKLGIEFKPDMESITLKEYYPLLISTGFSVENGVISGNGAFTAETALEAVNQLSGIIIKARSPVRVGARLGRPEKAGDRKMKPKVHVLFPILNYGDNRRSILNAAKNKTEYTMELNGRVCKNCGNETPLTVCENCGSVTYNQNQNRKMKIDLGDVLQKAESRLNIRPDQVKELKGVKKLMSKNNAVEPIEKGILRSIHDISINKDGTCRYDMSDIPITHFKKSELNLTSEQLERLGYPDQELNEIYPQDIIIPEDSARYLLNVANFVDDLLVRYYNMQPYYSCHDINDLIGELVIGLAPHTSGGIVSRIIGFSRVSGCYAHPFYHAAKRRNCDGDEDSIMLLLEGLLDFSRDFLPSTTGGLMDAPLVLTVLLDPEEVDKEAMNVDTLWKYPLEFYQATEKGIPPSQIEKIMLTMKTKIETQGIYTGSGFSFDTSDLNGGVLMSAYKTIDSMEEKIEKQLGLATKLLSVDENDVAARVISSHFLPDMFGNMRSFFTQEFRCTKCNTKFRRIPLSGKCLKCGSDNIILTIHHGSIVKYLKETEKVMDEYELPVYLQYQIRRLIDSIDNTFDVSEPAKIEETTLESFK